MSDATHAHEAPGHHWKDAERVRDFAQRMDRRADERGQQFRLMAEIIGREKDTALRILDLGAGYGAVSAALLEAYPNATALLLDVSEEMIALGRTRMSAYEGRYEYMYGDFADGTLPEHAGTDYDAIVSSLAIHHLTPKGKQELYSEIFSRVADGGWFLNLDIVAAADEESAAVYGRLFEADRRERGEQPWPAEAANRDRSHHSERETVEQHLAWLREAGFRAVDCYWKRMGTALCGGRRG